MLTADTLPSITAEFTVEEGNTSETLAVVEGVDNHRLLWLEDDTSGIVGLEFDTTIGLLVTSVLTLTPVNLDHTACSTTASHVSNWRVSNLDGSRDVEHLDRGLEVGRCLDAAI